MFGEFPRDVAYLFAELETSRKVKKKKKKKALVDLYILESQTILLCRVCVGKESGLEKGAEKIKSNSVKHYFNR